MNTTEIQKNIPVYQTPKRQKKSPLNPLKKSKKKSNPPSSKKKLFYQRKLQRFQKSKIFNDDISLETNSTTNTYEEDNLITNEKMTQYFDEIEFVMKDICEKGFYPLENIDKFFIEKKSNSEPKKGNVKYSNINYKNILENVNPNEKIKLILDIDETLVYSQVIKEIQINKSSDPNFFRNYELPKIQNIDQDEYYISVFSDIQEKIFTLKVKVRKGLALFFKKLSVICEFYINTMASKPYVSEILKILENNYDFSIKKENIMYTSPQAKKQLDETITKDENFLILDDNICAWEVGFIPSIIPVKKFNDVNFLQSDNIDIFYQYYLFSNKIYCFNEAKGSFINSSGKIPHCVEVTETEKNKNSQLTDISEIIIKSFILKKLMNIQVRHCLHFIQNTILKNCKIYYQGLEPDFITEMIVLLGGNIIYDLNDIQNATHIIYNKNFFKIDENKIGQISKGHCIDVKWIFDCFFKFKKCDENDQEYKL